MSAKKIHEKSDGLTGFWRLPDAGDIAICKVDIYDRN